jgi:hypothetical protein
MQHTGVHLEIVVSDISDLNSSRLRALHSHDCAHATATESLRPAGHLGFVLNKRSHEFVQIQSNPTQIVAGVLSKVLHTLATTEECHDIVVQCVRCRFRIEFGICKIATTCSSDRIENPDLDQCAH